MKNFLCRLQALIKKEYLQLSRDRSSLLIGIVLPIILILIIGYGISMDVKNVPTAVVLQDASPTVRDMLSFMKGSPYFSPRYVFSLQEAEELMRRREADLILQVPADFTANLYQQKGKLQLILYGVDSATANAISGYTEAAIGRWQAQNQSKFLSTGQSTSVGTVTVVSRMWFNDANNSTWYFVPGLMVLIMTIVGVFLTALVMAREWERGTLEAIFVTPVRPAEILLAKTLPYSLIALLGFSFCLLTAYYLFGVPLHGSLVIVYACSTLYLLVSLGMGLVISTETKSQFLACQVAMVISLLPTMMLSGFLFDLRSVPSFIRWVGYLLPATYYLQLLKSLMLAGNNWSLILKNCSILTVYALVFLGLALKVTTKKVD